MGKKGIGITLLAAGSLCMVGGLASIGWGIARVVGSFRTIATLESSGRTSFTVEEPGTVTLWHDYQTIHQGTTVEHPSSLPSGFHFQINDPVRGLKPMDSRSMTTTMSSGPTSRMAVGSFELPEAGTYELIVEGPEPRIFSLTEGGSMAGIGGFFGGMGLGILGGMLGFGLLLAGVIVLLTAKRKTPPPPPPAG
jgi:hypothetical protein